MKLPGEDIEIVSDENGVAYKLKNGLMIVTQRYSDSVEAINTAWGSVYSAETSTPPNFPVEFIDVPTVTRNIEIQSGGNVWFGTTDDKNQTTRASNFNLFRGTSWSNTLQFIVNIIAIGRWK